MYLGFTVFKIKCSVQAKRDVLVVAETMASLTYLRPIIHNLLIDGVSANVEARSSLSQLPVSWLTRTRKFARGSLKSVAAYREIDMESQLEDLERGCNILSGTLRRILRLVDI